MSNTNRQSTLKQAYTGTKGWIRSWSQHTQQNPEEKDEYFINMHGFKSKKQHTKKDTFPSTLNLSVTVDANLRKSIENEQNTRRLTLERENRKQMLKRKKEEKQIFDIALLINNRTNEYYKILCGPVIYEVFYGYVRFTDCCQYIQNDIHILTKSAFMVAELNGNQIFEYFCNCSSDPNDDKNGVTFLFSHVSKCQFFRFKHRELWDNHRHQQQNTNCDLYIVVNNNDVPIYILLDVHIDLVEQKIEFREVHPYQDGDVHVLDQIALRSMDFLLNKSFLFYKKGCNDHNDLYQYNFAGTKAMFKFGICYNFTSKDSKNKFYHQLFDIALAMNDDDEFIYLLNGIEYDLANKNIQYEACQFYRNGDYNQLKECGKEVKCIRIKEFKINTIDQSKYNLNSCKKCVLFNLNDKYVWNDYTERQKISQFDIATITDCNDYQSYTLFDVTVNWMDHIIDYKMSDEFNAEHHGLIVQYGELLTNERMDEFVVNNFDKQNKVWNNIFFYQLTGRNSSNSMHHKVRKRESMIVNKRRNNTVVSRNDVDKMKENKTMNTKHINDVWNAYIDKYGCSPGNAQQLKSFSREHIHSRSLSYFEALNLFKKNHIKM